MERTAWPEEQPGSDRFIDPGQIQIRPNLGRHVVDPCLWRGCFDLFWDDHRGWTGEGGVDPSELFGRKGDSRGGQPGGGEGERSDGESSEHLLGTEINNPWRANPSLQLDASSETILNIPTSSTLTRFQLCNY